MNGHSYGDRKPMAARMPSSYMRKDKDLQDLWDDSSHTGINFSKYDKIPVTVQGENKPRPLETFDQAGFGQVLKSNIKRAQYTTPTPVQKYGIPIIKEGRDLMATAQTGSGKTAAFLFPMIDKLTVSGLGARDGLAGAAVAPQVVIMAPTRELVIQIYEEATKFSGGTDLRCCISYGGTSVHDQLLALSRGCNILAATPGRLLDFVERGRISFANVQFLVLDEADRMLDMGFMPQIKNCVYHKTMNKSKQTLMFSATFPVQIQRLAREFLNNYLFLTVGVVGGACTDVRQTFHNVSDKPRMERNEMLVDMLKGQGRGRNNNQEKTLIFVERKKHADVLALFLCQEDLPATTIHGDRAQEEREMAIADFSSGRKPVLVATAVAARGLDIKGVTHVVNFEMPKEVEEYVHRIGRTGRVGNTGRATSFFDFKDDSGIVNPLVNILTDAKQPIPDWMVKRGRY